MAIATVGSINSTSLFTPLVPLRPNPHFSQTLNLTNSKPSIFLLSCSSPKSIPVTEQQVLQAIADSDDKSLPCVRIFENDLSQLTLVGAVDFQQALTAAAADGGQVASDHIDAGVDAMVVETVFPAPSSDNGTISTRLFLPAKKVKEKAAKLRKSFSQDVFSSTTSNNVLAMTFRQVVLQQVWSFDLIVFQPGEERKMEDLENPREKLSASLLFKALNDNFLTKHMVVIEVVSFTGFESLKGYIQKILQSSYPNYLKMR